jgi:hypothetical protein
MKAAVRLSASQRDRALGRVRTVTVSAAVAGTAAMGAFGYLAIQTNAGTQAANVPSDTTTTAVVVGGTPAATNPGTTPTPATTNTGSTALQPAPTSGATPTLQPAPTPAATPTTTRRHATSGGS